LMQHPATGIVFNAAFRPENIVYDENYQNEQGCSAFFGAHLREVADIVQKYAHGKNIFEIGCGKGRFTELLRTRDMNAIGIDPAYEGHSSYIIRKPFSASLGLSGDIIVLRHVLEHIPNPFEFLKEISTSNGGSGLIYIEVPCLDWIIGNNAWYDIFYEHVNYFRLSDFTRFFGTILECGRLFGGQYLFVVADLGSLGTNSHANKERFLMPPGFFSGIDNATKVIKQTIDKCHIIWGAASKGVLFSLHLQRAGYDIDFAIDINPAKQNKYLPVTGLQVLSPETALERLSPTDVIFVTNPNYLDEIKRQGGSAYDYRLA